MYSNAGPHLISAVLAESTGRSVLDYAREFLFEPLGIQSEPAMDIVVGEAGAEGLAESRGYRASDFSWPVDPQGVNLGLGYLKLRPQDLAALGLAYLAGGRSADGARSSPKRGSRHPPANE